ncbi:hypothetical protein [Psychrosphaera algicola]|uniref:Uncharacterized protein n=1 Tax=Psychrosphaera algicola TaxID=3023714 RepID=A0ABT5FHH3_9GAMM|nr:hypothetical protein [Psychrosphaera sp. G1-22]MDC2890640.1 hypothetical protein [Psychrosphaera sp. G1-22]
MGIKFWFKRAAMVFSIVSMLLLLVELAKGHVFEQAILFALTWGLSPRQFLLELGCITREKVCTVNCVMTCQQSLLKMEYIQMINNKWLASRLSGEDPCF